MGTIGSIRTATRWPLCSLAVLAAFAAACTTGTVRVYTPPQTAARISLAEMQNRLAGMMVVECPRLVGSRDRRKGSLTIWLALDSAGRVQQASIRKGSGDASFDDLAGGLAARLALAAPRQMAAADPSRRLTVLYECANAAAVVRLVADSA